MAKGGTLLLQREERGCVNPEVWKVKLETTQENVTLENFGNIKSLQKLKQIFRGVLRFIATFFCSSKSIDDIDVKRVGK